MTWNFSHTVELARGEYFRWHAHDDSVATLLERCVEALESNPEAVLAYPRVQMIDDRGQPLPDDLSTWRPPLAADGSVASDDRAKSESSAAARYLSPLYTGTPIETRGT